MKQRLLISIWLIAITTGVILYATTFRSLVELAYTHAAPMWLVQLIDALYPRFWVEKQRFELAFFLQKADQVVLRFVLVNGLVIAYFIMQSYSRSFAQQISLFWDISISYHRVAWLRILFFTGVLFFTYEWYGYMLDLSEASAFYKPLPLLRVMHISFPAPTTAFIVYGVLLFSCLMTVLNRAPVFFSTLAAVTFILLQGWLYSFEKMDHTFATITYAILLMPFLMYQAQVARRMKKDLLPGWPLQLICLSICLVYFQAGLEKMLIAGPAWLSADSFRGYLYLHTTATSAWVAQYDILCILLPLMALLLQLGFISLLFFPRLKPYLLASGLAFHAGTYILLNVGWYVGPWAFAYVFFIHWEKLPWKRHILVKPKGVLIPN